MKRILCMLLSLAMVLSVPMVGITNVAADEAAESALVDQLSVIGSYADSTEVISQSEVGSTPSLEISPSPQAPDVEIISKFSFLMINMQAYSGRMNGVGDLPLDENFFYSLRTSLASARDSQSMVGIRFRFTWDGTNGPEPDWDNMIEMFLDIKENGVLEEYADVISWCEMGTLGAYGEQHSTRYGDYGYSDELIDLYLNILPGDIPVLLRTTNRITHYVNSKLGTSYDADSIQRMVSEVSTVYAEKRNDTANYYSGDGKDFSTGNLMSEDLARLGLYNDGYLGTLIDYGTYSNRANETAFLNDQADVPYGGELSGDRYLQIADGGENTVWYPINAIPEMYYTNLAYLHSSVWSESAVNSEGEPYQRDFSTVEKAKEFQTQYNKMVTNLGRTELVDTVTYEEFTKDSGEVVYRATYTALGYDTLPFTETMEIASEEKIGATLNLSEYHGLSSKKFIEDHMGYRLIVRDSDMSGTVLPGGTFEYDIDIENTGFHKIYLERELELLFVNGGQSFTALLSDVDVRDWDAGTNNLSGSVTLPENMAGGDWQVYLRISPVNENADDDTAYGVKFANADIYNADLGANLVGAVTVDAEEAEVEAFVDSRPAGAYYDGSVSYDADATSIPFLEKTYTFTQDGLYGFTILFKLDGIAEGSEINLTRWHTNGTPGASNNMQHAFNYFFRYNDTYTFGKTLTENGYYMIYCPFYSVSNNREASVAGTTRYSSFYVNHSITSGNVPKDQSTPTSLNGNPATITPLGFVEGAVTSYNITLHMPDNTTIKLTGTYNFKNTDRAVSENVQFLQGTSVYSRISAYKIAGYTDENGVPYKFAGWTTQKGFREGLISEDQIALGTLDLYPYYEPDLSASAARLNGLVKTVTDGVDADGIFYTLDADTRTALVGTGSDWYGNAGFTGNDAILPAYLDVDGVIYTVTGIADNAFSRCTALSNVYIPQTYTDISASAFAGVEGNITVYASNITAADLEYADVLGYADAKGIANAELSAGEECVVVFGGEDGEIWQVSVQATGETAAYDGTLADKEGDESYCHYEFSGWSGAPYTTDTYSYPVYVGADHVAGDKVYESEGSCGVEVAYTISCTSCGELMESGSEVRFYHEYGEYISDENATCTEDGTKSATCGICGGTDTIADEGSATGHSYGEYVSDGNASCGVDGTKTAKCENCDAVDTVPDEGSALTHNYVWNVTTQPTFGVPGVNTGVCENCGDTKTEEIPALTKGDVNKDNSLNILDLTLTARYIAQEGLTGSFDLSACNVDAMDYNSDGVVDQLDLNEIGLSVIAQ